MINDILLVNPHPGVWHKLFHRIEIPSRALVHTPSTSAARDIYRLLCDDVRREDVTIGPSFQSFLP